jgi:tRNA 2-selenouridine synthase
MRFDNPIEIKPEQLRDLSTPIVDVRSEGEYAEGHIPGSINIALFSDAERDYIGRVYKTSPRAARFTAMEVIGPKLTKFVRRIHQLTKNKNYPVIVSCWRGGMRSKAAVDLLRMAGVDALQLEGGYRSYRRFIKERLDSYQLSVPVVIIKGKSGTGKTEIIKHVKREGFPALDLEALAGHRGSAFGGYAGHASVSQKTFDSLLLAELDQAKGEKWLLMEGESKRIGNLYIPDFLFKAMGSGYIIEAVGSITDRVKRTLEEYIPKSAEDVAYLQGALKRIKGKLSQDKFTRLTDYLAKGEYREFAQLLLVEYYDNIYDFQLPGREYLFSVDSTDSKKAAMEIAAALKHFFSDSGGKNPPVL